jgi:hypothetical protein
VVLNLLFLSDQKVGSSNIGRLGLGLPFDDDNIDVAIVSGSHRRSIYIMYS